MTTKNTTPARHRLLTTAAAAAATAGLMVLGTGIASAHVTVSPNKTAEGSYAHATFSVPNESDSATTDQLTVALPKDTPFTSVSVQPVEGWTATVRHDTLEKPVTVHGTTVTEAATSVTWKADQAHQIGQDEFQTFTVSLGTLPSAGTAVVLPATQHYTDGTVVKWDDPAGTGGQEPEHPAPSFTTTAAPAESGDAQHGSGSSDAAQAAEAAQGSEADASTGGGIGVAALWIGVAGLLVGAIALVRTVGSSRKN
ncbi:YcnI family protein [Arthrobacter sp. JSM 101049]|uniref:YcnI family copper-binding membrane protein n=1 Tax=Arthrobacter sp. JSM 101049 TaxID=929097 RepID=UPI003569D630